MTEPCDVTIGGATWLDQAQETAARTNQNKGPHRRKVGQQRAAPISEGSGTQTGQERQQTAADPQRKEAAAENCQQTATIWSQVQRRTEVQGEAGRAEAQITDRTSFGRTEP